ncbi:MAG: sugar transferase [Legionella sp.]|nr:sugar transferase [Legionella sp.]
MCKPRSKALLIKRLMDIVIASFLLLLLWPVLLIVAFLIVYCLGLPLFFKQERPGFKEKRFKLLKFRTMKEARDATSMLLPDEKRMTPLGKFLRSTSFDEWPELWNVLKGEMSLVGPRPLLVEYLPLYSSKQKRRHDMRPGITGWAQVNGRNSLSWEEKFNLDLWYIDNYSLKLDLKIMALTVKKVLKREGITGNNEVTAKKFTGSEKKNPTGLI